MGLMKTARDGEAPRSKDAPSPVLSGAVYTDYLESRRVESREYYDEMGAGRLRWIGRLDRPWVIGHSGEGIRPHAASAT